MRAYSLPAMVDSAAEALSARLGPNESEGCDCRSWVVMGEFQVPLEVGIPVVLHEGAPSRTERNVEKPGTDLQWKNPKIGKPGKLHHQMKVDIRLPRMP